MFQFLRTLWSICSVRISMFVLCTCLTPRFALAYSVQHLLTCLIQLTDSFPTYINQFITDVTKFISGCMASLSAMVQLELPHVNILSKMDLVTRKRDIEELVAIFILLCVFTDFDCKFCNQVYFSNLCSIWSPIVTWTRSLRLCCLNWMSAWLLNSKSLIRL